MKARLLLGVFAAIVVGCVQYVTPPIILARDRAAADLMLRDYRRTMPAPDQYARGAFCPLEKTLEQYGDGGIDAGGDIDCNPAPPPKPPAKGSPEALCTEQLVCVDGFCTCIFRQDAGK